MDTFSDFIIYLITVVGICIMVTLEYMIMNL